ncbi:unnamed protein product [Microthlaspi erraticum]|uniref:K Homology domain-containing protein n=1 Tax=Microthlaspi erraticum TaxID=1685480 RepID=A0A6D2J1C0_9BRAS|nr:unnamed protein product [Microthlaspi erraticum]
MNRGRVDSGSMIPANIRESISAKFGSQVLISLHHNVERAAGYWNCVADLVNGTIEMEEFVAQSRNYNLLHILPLLQVALKPLHAETSRAIAKDLGVVPEIAERHKIATAKDERKQMTKTAPSVSYGSFSGTTSKKIDIPNMRVGVIIGKGGETIKNLQQESAAKIQVTRDMDAEPGAHTRTVDLTGTPAQIAKAEQLISDVLQEAEARGTVGSGGRSSRRMGGEPGSDQFSMKIPNDKDEARGTVGTGGRSSRRMGGEPGSPNNKDEARGTVGTGGRSSRRMGGEPGSPNNKDEARGTVGTGGRSSCRMGGEPGSPNNKDEARGTVGTGGRSSRRMGGEPGSPNNKDEARGTVGTGGRSSRRMGGEPGSPNNKDEARGTVGTGGRSSRRMGGEPGSPNNKDEARGTVGTGGRSSRRMGGEPGSPNNKDEARGTVGTGGRSSRRMGGEPGSPNNKDEARGTVGTGGRSSRRMGGEPGSPNNKDEACGTVGTGGRSSRRMGGEPGSPNNKDEARGTVGSGGRSSRRMGGEPGSDQFSMKIPNNKVLNALPWRLSCLMFFPCICPLGERWNQIHVVLSREESVQVEMALNLNQEETLTCQRKRAANLQKKRDHVRISPASAKEASKPIKQGFKTTSAKAKEKVLTLGERWNQISLFVSEESKETKREPR